MDWAQLIEVRELCMCAEYRMLPDTFLTVQYIHLCTYIHAMPFHSIDVWMLCISVMCRYCMYVCMYVLLLYCRCIGAAAIAIASRLHTRD